MKNNERINEHDKTKQMMEIMRGGYISRLITEDELASNNVPSPELAQDSDINSGVFDGTRDFIIPDESFTKLAQDNGFFLEQQKFVNTLDRTIKLTDIWFRLEVEGKLDNIIIWGEALRKDEKGDGFYFSFSLNDPKIITNSSGVDASLLPEIQRLLNGYMLNMTKDGNIFDSLRNGDV